MKASESRYYTFGEFRIDAVARQLSRRDGTPVVMTSRVFDTLVYLVRHAGMPLGKSELLAAIWPGRVVEENNLTQSISSLRKAFGGGAEGLRYIVTEPGRGYRFVADVVAVPDETTAPAIEKPGTAVASPNPSPHIPHTVAQPARAKSLMPWMLLAAVVLLGLVVAGTWFGRTPRSTATPMPATTIAVLPFKPVAAGERDEVLELGMADTLIAKLSSSRRLVVRSLGSVRKFSGLDQDPLAAGHELDVGSVLEGQVQRRADHLHVTARLLSVPSGAALWAGTFDEDFTDIFAVQDTIAQKVAAALSLELDHEEEHAMRAGYSNNPDAYLLYLQGRYRIGKVTPSEIHAGMELFRKAIDLDPTFALAYAALAEAYRRLPITSDVDPKEAFPLARAAAQKALQIDDGLADAHSALGWVAFWYDWNWAAAEKEFKRAIELNPNVMEAHLGYGHLLSCIGRNAEAAVQGRLARELDPLSPLVNTIAGFFLMDAGYNDEAQTLFDNALAIDPDFWVAHLQRGGVALRAHDYPTAIAEFTRAREHSGGSMQAISMLGHAIARSGDRAGAQTLLDELKRESSQRYVPATSIGTIRIALGDNEGAIASLQRAYEQRDVRMAFLKVDHRWDPLRADPRFVVIARRMGLQ